VSWILTYTGKKVYPFDPQVEQIDIKDIAHALSMKCRFSGQCSRFYSVAQHSVFTAHCCSFGNRLWGLLHDASEAYLGDVPSPIKRNLPNYKSTEDRLLRTIAQRFDLSWPIPSEVKDVDKRMLNTEAIAMWKTLPEDWGVKAPPFYKLKITSWPPEIAEMMFLNMFAAARV